MRWIGIASRALGMMIERASSREVEPGRTLGDKGRVREWIAESRAEIHGAKLMVLHAAWKIEHEGMKAAQEEIGLIKFHVAGVMHKVVDRAIQVHGALGLTEDTPLAWYYRHERASRIYDGPDEVHKDSVARRLLRKTTA